MQGKALLGTLRKLGDGLYGTNANETQKTRLERG